MREQQGISTLGDGEITYKSDTDPTHYQMLTLEEPPLSYLDFDNADLDETTVFANSFVKNNLVPNKEYYITFRARDLAGFSNPTRVFKFVLNHYPNEAPYINLDVYDFDSQIQSQRYEITSNGAISIDPALQQTAIDFSNSENYQNIDPNSTEFVQTSRGTDGLTLGLRDPEESVWGKKFCVEMVSKTTGKKIRFMIKYAQEVLQSQEQEELESISGELVEDLGEEHACVVDPFFNRAQLVRSGGQRKSVFDYQSKEFLGLQHQFNELASIIKESDYGHRG